MKPAREDPTSGPSREVWVDIGRIGKPFGLKGEVVIHYYGDAPDRFEVGSQVFLVTRGGRRSLRVASSRRMPRKLVARFDGCHSIEEIKPWVNAVLQIRAQDLPPLEGPQAYHFELIGLKVYAADGRYLGVLEEILATGANDVYCIRHEGREVLIPAIQDAIESVDPDEGRMTLKNLEGLIDP
ncbi:MAG: 16S rRNA processing protein RimM [Candidatus Eisenbacteria sp.]|nr:16S rRNA processing protein RimM [Candidatus Eisenbacteria bacterium]